MAQQLQRDEHNRGKEALPEEVVEKNKWPQPEAAENLLPNNSLGEKLNTIYENNEILPSEMRNYFPIIFDVYKMERYRSQEFEFLIACLSHGNTLKQIGLWMRKFGPPNAGGAPWMAGRWSGNTPVPSSGVVSTVASLGVKSTVTSVGSRKCGGRVAKSRADCGGRPSVSRRVPVPFNRHWRRAPGRARDCILGGGWSSGYDSANRGCRQECQD
jgi:hypothetical protein